MHMRCNFGCHGQYDSAPLGVRKALLSWRGVGSWAGNSLGVRCWTPLLGDTLNTTPPGFAALDESAAANRGVAAEMLSCRPGGEPPLVLPVGEVFGEVRQAEEGAPVGLRGVRAKSRRGVLAPAREDAVVLREASRKPTRALFGGEADFGGELALHGVGAVSGDGILLSLRGNDALAAVAIRSSSRGTAQMFATALNKCSKCQFIRTNKQKTSEFGLEDYGAP